MIIRQNYRIYPSNTQETTLVKWLGQARFVWNFMLNATQKQYSLNRTFIFGFDMNKLLPELKKQYIWLKEVPSQVLQQKCRDLDQALTGLFRDKHGFPKYKSRHTDTSGIAFPQSCKLTDKLYLPKMKSGIKVVIDTPLKGNMKSCTVYRNRASQWFASIVVELPEDYYPEPKTHISSVVGIDVGLKEFMVTSDGETVDNPRFLKKSLKKLKRAQRHLSRCNKGSNNRNKKRLKLARIHNKIKNQRKDFIKKTANSIAKNYDLICVETLNVKNMVKNHNLAQAISDVSWNIFFDELKWQATKVGSHVVQIDQFYASSKTCSRCGHKKDILTLSERIYECDSCHFSVDRDANAALNIEHRGIEIFLKKNTVGTTEINACQIRDTVGFSGQEVKLHV